MKRGVHYISWTGRGGSDKVNSCHTTASLENCIKDIGVAEKVTVHEMSSTNVDHSTNVTPSNVVQNIEKMPLVDTNLLEFINSSEPILDNQMLNIVAALNRPMANGKVVCWWCDKPAHTANECFLKKQGKPPLPHSRFGKKDKNKQFTATNKVPDQIAQRSVNQIQFEQDMAEKKELQMEYLISKGMDINQRYAPI